MNVLDLYCGAGGSSTGLAQAGFFIKEAANHWELAIQTHQINHPDTAHACVDLYQGNPAWFSRTELLWASPECKTHSPAGGRKRKNPGQMHLWAKKKPEKPSDIRSRMGPYDVLRMAEFHRQPYICVENVLEFAEWEMFDHWLDGFAVLGYKHQLLSLNSQFVGVPQSRDRLFVIFHHKGNPKPNVDFRFKGFCRHKQAEAFFYQAWKPDRYIGAWGPQYVYQCECCHKEGIPHRVGSRVAIDWSLPSTRICDRSRPLSPNTIRRIKKGIERFYPNPFVINRGYSTDPKYDRLKLLDGPSDTLTTSNKMALVNPPAFVDVLRRHANPLSLDEPSATVAAQGNHHALVQPPLPFVQSYYGSGGSEALVSNPATTVRTVQSQALIEPDIDLVVENCFYRMLKPHESQILQGFAPDYQILGNQTEKFAQVGNAVPPGMARLIGGAIADALNKYAWV
jgi:DNA (cytosine-5)-methyltransferase 1